MPRKSLLSLSVILGLVTLALAACDDGPETRVLFIGNSLTYANDLPGMIADIAAGENRALSYEVHAPGGSRLADHSRNRDLRDLLQSEPWDIVVLQEQSQYPAFSDGQVARDVLPYARQLVSLAREANPEVEVLFYMTMARQNGDPQNVKFVAALKTYEGMQRRINRSYLNMARQNKAAVAPVGDAWETFRIRHPSVNLYADPVHPNPAGSYLAACVFFSSLFATPCQGTDIPQGLDPSLAADIQAITDKSVLGPRQKWSWRQRTTPAN